MNENKLTLEEQLIIFRKVCGNKRTVTNSHTNVSYGNTVSIGYSNQGISKVKLKEFIEKEGVSFEYWKTI